MAKGNHKQEKQKELPKQREADRIWNQHRGANEEGGRGVIAEGFTGCGKEESSAHLKVPSHCFWCDFEWEMMIVHLDWSSQSYLNKLQRGILNYLPINKTFQPFVRRSTNKDKCRSSFLPITTKLTRGFPPCLFSSSAFTLMVCRDFPAERLGVGTVEASSALGPLDGVSGRLEVTSVTGAVSGLPPRRVETLVTPFSSVLRRESGRV